MKALIVKQRAKAQPGMTIKQFRRAEFRRLLEAYREARSQINTMDGRKSFVILSVQLHAAKANVPRSWRQLINA